MAKLDPRGEVVLNPRQWQTINDISDFIRKKIAFNEEGGFADVDERIAALKIVEEKAEAIWRHQRDLAKRRQQ